MFSDGMIIEYSNKRFAGYKRHQWLDSANASSTGFELCDVLANAQIGKFYVTLFSKLAGRTQSTHHQKYQNPCV